MEGVDGFDWDEGNLVKCQKHGVTIAEIESLFAVDPGMTADIEHSQSEVRVRAVGRAISGRHIFVVFTVRTRRGMRLIRPISARYMHAKDVRRYEETRS